MPVACGFLVPPIPPSSLDGRLSPDSELGLLIAGPDGVLVLGVSLLWNNEYLYT